MMAMRQRILLMAVAAGAPACLPQAACRARAALPPGPAGASAGAVAQLAALAFSFSLLPPSEAVKESCLDTGWVVARLGSR